jgi:outer membrane receptor protein involved in Fe transport
MNLRSYWKPATGTILELFGGGSWDKNTVPRGNEGHFRNHFGMLKLSHDLSQNSSFEILASQAYALHAIIPTTSTLQFGDVDYTQTDLDAVHRFGWLNDQYQTTWGGNYRIAEASADKVFEGKPAQVNRTLRGFVQQSVRIWEPLTLVGAVSLERSDTGGTQPAYQAGALINPIEGHTFRISYSVAPTLPNLYEKGVNHLPSPFARIVGNPDLKPEKLKSYEVGYLGAYLARRLRVESSIFYMGIQDLSASFQTANPSPPPTSLVSFSNNNEAIARGLEMKGSYWFSPGRTIYVNYTFEKITAARTDIMVEDATPSHKINLGGMMYLAEKVTAGLDAGYKTSYTTIPANRNAALITKISPYWRLDARLTYSPTPNMEVAIAGQNLLMSQHKEFSDFDQLEVPRTYFGSVALRF